MTIHIEDLKFQTIIGILDFERETEQEVVINIVINYNYENKFINYAEVVELVQSTMIQSKFLLIEDALAKLSKSLKENFSLIDTLFIKITKPTIIENAQVSVSQNYTF